MNEQQRSTATVDGYIVELVIIDRVAPAADKGAQALYGVRIGISGDDSGVTIALEPPSVHERGRVLLEARRLLQRKEERTQTREDRQMLTQAITNVMRAIDALP